MHFCTHRPLFPDTVIIDSEENVRTCWNGEPVGKVGMTTAEIKGNLEALHDKTETGRGCSGCTVKTSCVACLFPAPLAVEEYCDARRKCNTGSAAELIRMGDVFKEL